MSEITDLHQAWGQTIGTEGLALAGIPRGGRKSILMPQPSSHRDSGGWQTLYRAAILETDWRCVGERISVAEEAIVARTRELFHQTGPDVEVERDALDDALYALRALRTAAGSTAAA